MITFPEPIRDQDYWQDVIVEYTDELSYLNKKKGEMVERWTQELAHINSQIDNTMLDIANALKRMPD